MGSSGSLVQLSVCKYHPKDKAWVLYHGHNRSLILTLALPHHKPLLWGARNLIVDFRFLTAADLDVQARDTYRLTRLEEWAPRPIVLQASLLHSGLTACLRFEESVQATGASGLFKTLWQSVPDMSPSTFRYSPPSPDLAHEALRLASISVVLLPAKRQV